MPTAEIFFVYVDLGAAKSGTRDLTIGGIELPAGVNANTHYDLKGTAWTLAGTYRVMSGPGATMDLLAGARMLDIKQTLEWEFTGNIGTIPVGTRAGRREASPTNWDGIVGVKGRFSLSDDHKWYVPYYFDIGTGESDLTWQAVAGVGYSFQWGDVVAAWRYLDYKMKSGQPVDTLNFNGPAIAAVFRW